MPSIRCLAQAYRQPKSLSRASGLRFLSCCQHKKFAESTYLICCFWIWLHLFFTGDVLHTLTGFDDGVRNNG